MGFLPGIGTTEILIVGIIALLLLLFGNNLPNVARNTGKSFSEFKKGVSGFQSEMKFLSDFWTTEAMIVCIIGILLLILLFSNVSNDPLGGSF